MSVSATPEDSARFPQTRYCNPDDMEGRGGGLLSPYLIQCLGDSRYYQDVDAPALVFIPAGHLVGTKVRNKALTWGIRQVTVPPEMNESSTDSVKLLKPMFEKMPGKQGMDVAKLLQEIVAPLKTEQPHPTAAAATALATAPQPSQDEDEPRLGEDDKEAAGPEPTVAQKDEKASAD